jgi:N-acetylglucosaminyl-diphospho-decaprenol L-rhamnosyltransferase
MQRISGIIVNYRTADATVQAVRSLQRSSRALQDIIVVDNGSGDDSLAHLAGALPDVVLLTRDRNGGFAAGANIGIRAALAREADGVLLLNSDATLAAEALGHLERQLDRAHPEIVESAGLLFSPSTGRVRLRCHGQRLDAVPRPPALTVPAVPASLMLIRRAVLDRIGLISEDYFFGFEDLDFCLRASAAGVVVIVAGAAIAHHEGHASIGRRSPRLHRLAARNHLLLLDRMAPLGGWRFMIRASRVLAMNLAQALTQSEVPRLRGAAAVLLGAADYVRRRAMS